MSSARRTRPQGPPLPPRLAGAVIANLGSTVRAARPPPRPARPLGPRERARGPRSVPRGRRAAAHHGDAPAGDVRALLGVRQAAGRPPTWSRCGWGWGSRPPLVPDALVAPPGSHPPHGAGDARRTPFIAVTKAVSRLLAAEEYDEAAGLRHAARAHPRRAHCRAGARGGGDPAGQARARVRPWCSIRGGSSRRRALRRRRRGPRTSAARSARLRPGPARGSAVLAGADHYVVIQPLDVAGPGSRLAAGRTSRPLRASDQAVVNLAVSLLSLSFARSEGRSSAEHGVRAAALRLLFDGRAAPLPARRSRLDGAARRTRAGAGGPPGDRRAGRRRRGRGPARRGDPGRGRRRRSRAPTMPGRPSSSSRPRPWPRTAPRPRPRTGRCSWASASATAPTWRTSRVSRDRGPGPAGRWPREDPAYAPTTTSAAVSRRCSTRPPPTPGRRRAARAARRAGGARRPRGHPARLALPARAGRRRGRRPRRPPAHRPAPAPPGRGPARPQPRRRGGPRRALPRPDPPARTDCRVVYELASSAITPQGPSWHVGVLGGSVPSAA